MKYNIYEQMMPSVKVKNKGIDMYEADIVFRVQVDMASNECPFEFGRALGIKRPMIEAVNGYNPETGNILK